MLGERLETMVVAVDFSETSEDAWAAACRLAVQTNSKVHLLASSPDPLKQPWTVETVSMDYSPIAEEWRQQARERLARSGRWPASATTASPAWSSRECHTPRSRLMRQTRARRSDRRRYPWLRRHQAPAARQRRRARGATGALSGHDGATPLDRGTCAGDAPDGVHHGVSRRTGAAAASQRAPLCFGQRLDGMRRRRSVRALTQSVTWRRAYCSDASSGTTATTRLPSAETE